MAGKIGANVRVMGIDPGTLKMGVGLIEYSQHEFDPLFYDTVTINKKLTLHKRLQNIQSAAKELFQTWQPDVVALEDVFFGASFKSAIRIGEARCAVILAAMQEDIAVVEYSPARVKSAVSGFGRAAKVQVQNMVKQILRLRELPAPDAADALALAICHINTMRVKR